MAAISSAVSVKSKMSRFWASRSGFDDLGNSVAVVETEGWHGHGITPSIILAGSRKLRCGVHGVIHDHETSATETANDR